jgi:hypothetical protein
MRYLVLFAALAVLFARFAVHVVAHAARAVALWLVTPLARIQAARGFVLGLTLVEAAKLETGDSYRSAVIELYAGSSSILSILDFMPIPGNALKYNREAELPGVGFRGVNEGYTPSTGVLNPLTEALVIAGGDLDVDKFIVDTMGARQRSVQEAMKVRALALAWTKKFFKGDSTADPREFDGLQIRVTGNQIIDAGATANGDALSLTKLDQAIARTLNCTHIVMNTAMSLKFIAAARTPTVSGNVTQGTDNMGRPITLYAGHPIVTVDLDGTGAEILPFTEASPGGGTATSTSIYCVSIGDDGLMGLENGGIDVRDLGELQTAPKYRTRVEWYNGIAIFNGRAVTRLRGIKDAAIVA